MLCIAFSLCGLWSHDSLTCNLLKEVIYLLGILWLHEFPRYISWHTKFRVNLRDVVVFSRCMLRSGQTMTRCDVSLCLVFDSRDLVDICAKPNFFKLATALAVCYRHFFDGDNCLGREFQWWCSLQISPTANDAIMSLLQLRHGSRQRWWHHVLNTSQWLRRRRYHFVIVNLWLHY